MTNLFWASLDGTKADRNLELHKIILVIAGLFITFAIVMYVKDFLPVDLFNSTSSQEYFKVVATDSVSISDYKLHALVVGIVFLIVGQIMSIFQ